MVEIEAHLLAGAPQTQFQDHIEALGTLQEEFETRMTFWEATLVDNPEIEAALQDVHLPAKEMFGIIEDSYLPAVLAGDTEAVIRIREAELEPLFREHPGGHRRGCHVGGDPPGRGRTTADSETQSATVVQLAVAVGVVVIGLLFGFLIVRSIQRPVDELKSVAERIAVGDVNQTITLHSKDELGQLAESFRGMIVYLKEMAGAADQLATGDLTVEVTPRSEGDQLGKSLHAMVDNLRELATALLGNAEQVAEAAEQMAQASAQAGQATQQIAVTMQQVARGSTGQQAASITATASSVEEMRAPSTAWRTGAGTGHGDRDDVEAMKPSSGAVADIRRDGRAGGRDAARPRCGPGWRTRSTRWRRRRTPWCRRR